MRLCNGLIVAGGKSQELIVLDDNLKPVKRIPLNGTLETGIAIKNHFYCGITAMG